MVLEFKPLLTRVELRDKCIDILDEFIRKAEQYYAIKIPTVPTVLIVRARRYYARIVIPKFGFPVIRVNRIFTTFYREDPGRTEKALRYTLAHEVGHIVQRKRYGVGAMMLTHPLAVNLHAHDIAKHISGISYDEFRDIVLELHRKTGTMVEKPLLL